jgi:hypothetical protein
VSQQSSLQRVKAATKLRAQTSKIVSSFKGTLISTSFAKEFTGHRDGVWDVSCPKSGQPFIGLFKAFSLKQFFTLNHAQVLLLLTTQREFGAQPVAIAFSNTLDTVAL